MTRAVGPQTHKSVAKVFLVTGSSRGLGRAITRAALESGNVVVATAREPEALDDLVVRFGGWVQPARLDVTRPEDAQAAVKLALSEFGRIDVLVNNAGYANLGSVEDTSLGDFRAQVETNFFGVVNVVKAALPAMRRQRSGYIVNVSSVGGRVANPGLGAYQSAKWAVGGFTEVLASELRPLGIHVTAIEPGGMRTDWAGSSMTIHPVSPPYQSTVGVLADLFAAAAGTNASDPAKVAAVVLRLISLDDPPVRLMLGDDALMVARAAEEARSGSDARWEWLSRTTTHDDATVTDLDPLRLGPL